MDQSCNTLWMLGVGEALKKAVGGSQGRKSHFGPVNQRSETPVMALAGFAEEHCFDPAPGAERFFDEADAFDADRARFRGQAAAKRQAELFQPAVVAARQHSWRGSAGSAAGGFAWRSHQKERNKFTLRGAIRTGSRQESPCQQ